MGKKTKNMTLLLFLMSHSLSVKSQSVKLFATCITMVKTNVMDNWISLTQMTGWVTKHTPENIRMEPLETDSLKILRLWVTIKEPGACVLPDGKTMTDFTTQCFTRNFKTRLLLNHSYINFIWIKLNQSSDKQYKPVCFFYLLNKK